MLRFAESHSSGCLHRLCVGCVFPWGWRDRLSTPQVQRLPLRRPRLPRRKRDCTPALFLTTSVSSSASTLRTSEEEGLAHSLPPHNGEEFSGGGGIGPPPHKSGEYIGGGGTGPPPHNDGVYFGGRETGSRPHTDECFMCHNGQDPLLFLADMCLMLYHGWLDTVWMLLKQNSDKRGVVFSSCLGNVKRSMLFSCLSP